MKILSLDGWSPNSSVQQCEENNEMENNRIYTEWMITCNTTVILVPLFGKTHKQFQWLYMTYDIQNNIVLF